MMSEFRALTRVQEENSQCPLCSHKLRIEDSKDYGFPPGRGQYGMCCRSCGFVWYYDRIPVVGEVR